MNNKKNSFSINGNIYNHGDYVAFQMTYPAYKNHDKVVRNYFGIINNMVGNRLNMHCIIYTNICQSKDDFANNITFDNFYPNIDEEPITMFRKCTLTEISEINYGLRKSYRYYDKITNGMAHLHPMETLEGHIIHNLINEDNIGDQDTSLIRIDISPIDKNIYFVYQFAFEAEEKYAGIYFDKSSNTWDVKKYINDVHCGKTEFDEDDWNHVLVDLSFYSNDDLADELSADGWMTYEEAYCNIEEGNISPKLIAEAVARNVLYEF